MNDLNIPGTDLWKYDGDSTISETVTKLEDSKVQQTVDEFAKQVAADEFQLNETKCTKLLITLIHPKGVNGQDWNYIEQAKILGFQISNNLSWNNHISEVVKKVNKCFSASV